MVVSCYVDTGNQTLVSWKRKSALNHWAVPQIKLFKVQLLKELDKKIKVRGQIKTKGQKKPTYREKINKNEVVVQD